MQHREYNLKRLAITVICMFASFPILCCGGFLFLDNFNAVSERAFDSLEEGMTKEEVKKILGSPNYERNGIWYYRVRNPKDIGTYSDSFGVHFDENGLKTDQRW